MSTKLTLQIFQHPLYVKMAHHVNLLILWKITNLSPLNPDNDSCVDVSILDVCNLTNLSSPNPNNDSLQSLIVNAWKLECKFTKP